jgi:hypothetical protein
MPTYRFALHKLDLNDVARGGGKSRGRQAAQRILDRMHEPMLAIAQRTEPVELIVRENSCPPPNANGISRHE